MASNGLLQRVRRTLRKLFVRAPFADRIDLHGKRIIVTGASPGSIGFETARAFASWGASVVVTTRSNPQEAADAIANSCGPCETALSLDAHALDLSEQDSVEAFVRWVQDQHGDRLDVLVNNAGVHLDLLSQWKEPPLSEDGHEVHWRTNYLGTMHLTHRLLPLLQETGKQHGDARVVNVVSHLHVKGVNEGLFRPLEPYNSWVAYGTSKLALVHAANEIQKMHAASSRLQGYSLHPGSVFTNVAAKGLAGNPLIETVRNSLASVEAFFLMSPEEGAQTSIVCATKPGLTGGRYFEGCQEKPPSAAAQDQEVAAKLWEETQSWVNGSG